MTTMEASGVAAREKWLPLWFLQGVAIYWLALKVGALFLGAPHADEAYYWMWGQHLALSYFDHAPLHAWLQGLVGAVFGWSIFSLRFLSIVSAAVTLAILYVWSKRLEPDQWRHYFWLTAALFFSSPVMLFYTTVATHDRILVACAILSIHFFAWFFADWAEGKRDRVSTLYLGALFLGLATLTKYNGALLGIGVALVILLRRDLRSILTSPHLYVAAVLSVVMQAPTLIWNLSEGFASLNFHLDGRPGLFDFSQYRFDATRVVLLESLVLLSPFAVIGMAVFLMRPAGAGFRGVVHDVAKSVFILSTATLLLMSFTRYVLFYWNILAYAAFFGLAAWFMRSRVLQALQIGWGILFNTILLIHFAVAPVLQMAGVQQPDASGVYGWDEVAQEVREARSTTDADFVATADWGQAARLGFALADKDVASLSARTDAFDFWFDDEARRGQDAIVVMERGDNKLDYVASRFQGMTKLGEFDVVRFGRTMFSYELYEATGFIPE